MSYILEALKKAQAERQLGATPTIHAPTLDSAVVRKPSTLQWKPLALAAGAVLAAGALVLWWRQADTAHVAPAAPQAALFHQATRQPAAAAPAAVVPAAPSPVAAIPDAVPSAPPPVAAAPASAAQAATQAAAPAAVPAVKLAAKPAVKPAPAPVEPQEETAQWLRELPEPIQRSIPAIAMGGYMYSRNPADRLLLIDKVLRREGEEVAPGLVLEKLQPKAAVFTFKGYRYRVPY